MQTGVNVIFSSAFPFYNYVMPSGKVSTILYFAVASHQTFLCQRSLMLGLVNRFFAVPTSEHDNKKWAGAHFYLRSDFSAIYTVGASGLNIAMSLTVCCFFFSTSLCTIIANLLTRHVWVVLGDLFVVGSENLEDTKSYIQSMHYFISLSIYSYWKRS